MDCAKGLLVSCTALVMKLEAKIRVEGGAMYIYYSRLRMLRSGKNQLDLVRDERTFLYEAKHSRLMEPMVIRSLYH